MKTERVENQFFRNIIPIFVFLFISFYTYSHFVTIPYLGFTFHSRTGKVESMSEHGNVFDFEAGIDTIISINEITISEEYANSPQKDYFSNFQPGEHLDVIVEREGELIEIDWEIPAKNPRVFVEKLTGQWFISYIFWGLGFAAYLFLRPKDISWKLFVAFSLITGMWLTLGSQIARFHFFYGLILLRALVWLTFPIFIHLHWEFPQPLLELKKPRKIIIFGIIYAIGIIGALREIVLPRPKSIYSLMFLASLLIGLILLIIRTIKFPQQRSKLKVIQRWIGLATLILFSSVLVSAYSPSLTNFGGGAVVLGMPLIPFAYFVALSRGRLGKYEFRSNRIVSIYLFVTFQVLLFLLLLAFGKLAGFSEGIQETVLTIGVLILLFSSVSIFRKFQNWVERVLLNIPVPQEDSIDEFMALISNFLEVETLAQFLKDTLMPSWQIRQSGLLLAQDKKYVWAYKDNVQNSGDVDDEFVKLSKEYTKIFLHKSVRVLLPKSLSWARVIHPLEFREEIIGYWVFGEKNPDDIYSAKEVEVLSNLSQQLSLALINMRQSGRLRAMFQENISRHESERAAMGREIHDTTLNSLAQFKEKLDSEELDEEIVEIIANLRKAIHGLRPEFLEYGLKPAIEDLGDSYNERQSYAKVEVLLNENFARLSKDLELQVFRIVQQACENALRHADPTSILIQGTISDDHIDLMIKDNGSGFSSGDSLDLSDLLEKKHYGLAIMHERATLVGVKIDIRSQVDQGTTIQLSWDL